jgi:hypothetical protein
MRVVSRSSRLGRAVAGEGGLDPCRLYRKAVGEPSLGARRIYRKAVREPSPGFSLGRL